MTDTIDTADTTGDGEQPSYNDMKEAARQQYAACSLRELVERMADLQRQKQQLDRNLTTLNAHLDVLRMERIPEVMDEQNVRTMSYSDIGRVTLTGDIFTQILNQPLLMEWLKSHNLGDIVITTINSSTLKAVLRKRIRDGGSLPEDAVKITPFVRASITKIS